ncbi:MAG: DNA helicase UvrBC [Clostridiaceae bacterium]|jgi:protein arginine kinase activator|nr:DNA helicase UvrBC [Clostridiaceae bacterium]
MSLCQICKQREATVYLTQIINGVKTKMSVCSKCAGTDGIKIDLNSLITGLLSMQNQERKTEGIALQCDRCGLTIDEFNNTGKIGCNKCYEVFFDPMQQLLNRIHGNTHHRGKVPNKFISKQLTDSKIDELKQELSVCIENEAYERAAEIRDRIKELTGEPGGLAK